MQTSGDEGFASLNEESQEGITPPLSARQKADIERKKRLAQKRKQQKKKSRKNKAAVRDEGVDDDEELTTETETNDDEVEIEYITEKPVEVRVDPEFIQFGKIFEKFDIKEESDDSNEPKKALVQEPTTKLEEDVKAAIIKAQGAAGGTKQAIIEKILKDEEDGKTEEENKKLSRRKMRIALRPSMAVLKASCPRPDVVEWHDVTARDPFFLVYLKSLRNTVPVPRHWNAKRKYLAGKRGFERPPFQLPDFIVKTGIMEMRAAIQEKEDSQSLKNMMRNRVRPKIGRVDIDYQKLHDAFFKFQTKPKMTVHGDLYYEGKEFEAQMREKKPGELSDDLRIALGMPVGPNAFKFPPPWLIAMQRYGPPPSYPHLKIPGLNAPIPEGCSFGYQAGGWGKPPVDEYGQPLYGDVFGLETQRAPVFDDVVQHQHWGEMEEESDESEDESDDEHEDDGDNKTEAGDVEKSGLQTPMTEGLITPSGLTSGVNTSSLGLETPESTIELRKQKQSDQGVETPSENKGAGQGPAKSLYQVLPEKKVDRISGQMMASTHVYDINKEEKKSKQSSDGIEVSLNPDELTEIGEEGLKKKYEEQLRKERGSKDDGDDDQDFSDMVAEHAARQKRKRKAEDKKSSSSTKKQKDFKF